MAYKTDPEPEHFSVASAISCAEAIFEGLPKSRQRAFIGELNEVLVVLGRVKTDDRNKELRTS